MRERKQIAIPTSHPSRFIPSRTMRTNRIQETFEVLKGRGEKALIPYIMAGDPSLAVTESLVLALEQGGADLIELGVPFSDPIADGPVIQQAAERALHSGTTLKKILSTVTNLRKTTSIPLILMAYYNTIMAMGIEPFCALAFQAGVDGLIVPDLPPEESDPLYDAARAAGGPVMIFLLAPTSTASTTRGVETNTRFYLLCLSHRYYGCQTHRSQSGSPKRGTPSAHITEARGGGIWNCLLRSGQGSRTICGWGHYR